MPARLRAEEGFGLVELLVAMTILSIGIFALVAGFSSGFGAINRASKTSVAGALADQRMEALRRGAYDAITAPAATTDPAISSAEFPVTGTDGRTYWVGRDVTLANVCGNGKLLATCTSTDGGTVGRPVKSVTLTVRAGSSTGDLLIRESSTFDQSTG
jgi:prepilin-type N-terminal cleavage/methylation domain-containing protein